MGKPRWLDNEELFKQELKKGLKWEEFVAKELRSSGFDVAVPDYKLNSIECKTERLRAAKPSIDMIVNGVIAEVKSRNYWFTCADDFPFDTIAVDTKESFDSKPYEKIIYICVSQHTGCMTFLDVKATHQHWEIARRFDTVRRINVVSYDCHKKYWEDCLEGVLDRLV